MPMEDPLLPPTTTIIIHLLRLLEEEEEEDPPLRLEILAQELRRLPYSSTPPLPMVTEEEEE